MQQINLALSWYATTVTTLILSSVLIVYLSFDHKIEGLTASRYHQYKALPASSSDITHQTIEINKSDARSAIVAGFFQSYKSPLADYAQIFIQVADQYTLDFRLLPAIAMQESNGAKIMPNNSFNPFGYGIYGGKVLRFESFEEAIERVGRGLRTDYLDHGLKNPEQIMAKYTPPSLAKDGAWAKGVTSFMVELR